MQGHQDTASFIQSFTGSHHFVLDYLLEEVLQQQSESVQAFLLRTSILDRLCGPLCDAVLRDTAGSGQDRSRPWSTSSAPTCLLSPWITSGAGTATIISLGISCASDWDKGCHPQKLQNIISAPACGMKRTGMRPKLFSMLLLPVILGGRRGWLKSAWQGMDNRFQTAAWLGWVKKLPEDVVRIRPVLSTQMAQAFMDAGEPEASEACTAGCRTVLEWFIR